MKTCFIINPQAGNAREAEALQDLLDEHDILYVETTEEGDARRLAKEALDGDVKVVVAVGGDGTVNEVVNGVMAHDGERIMGIIPMGTGNDLARTLWLPTDPFDALRAIQQRDLIELDVIEVETAGHYRFAANAVSGGFSGQVNEAMDDEMKEAWGPLAYLRGTATAVADLQAYQTRIVCDGEALEPLEVYNVIVANGRTIGGGKRIAPVAEVSDGWLDLVVTQTADALGIADMSARLLAGTLLEHPAVIHRRVKHVEITASPAMGFNVDGEMDTAEKVTCTIHPAALRMIVGPEYPHPTAT